MNRSQLQNVLMEAVRRRQNEGPLYGLIPSEKQNKQKYEKAVRMSKKINDIVSLLRGPAAMATKAFVEDEQKRRQIQRILRAISRASAGPKRRKMIREIARKAQNKGATSAAKEKSTELLMEAAKEAIPDLLEAGVDQYI